LTTNPAPPVAIELTSAPLTRAAFAPYGEVIDTDSDNFYAINQGTTLRFHDLARVDVASEGGGALINIFRGQPRSLPIEIRTMERHPLGSQAFVPLQDHVWLVVVSPPGQRPRPDTLQAFRSTGRQGVNYRRGVWHHPLLVLRPDHDFLVVDRGGPGENCDEIHFDGEVAHLVAGDLQGPESRS